MFRPRLVLGLLGNVLISTALLGQADAVPNWTVPPYRLSGVSGGLTTMTDISPGVGFVAIQPCRVVDTRGGGAFTGTYGPPAMLANAQRSFDINSAPHCPGIPAGVDAYSLNFTVTQTAGAPGDIRVWPTGNSPPPAQITSVLNWTTGNATLANATIVPAGTGGSIDVYVAGTATQLLIDINGYFTDDYNVGVSFHAVSSSIAPALLGENTSTVANAVAVQGVITSATPGSFATGVRGISNGYGVWGSSTNGFGVVATTGGTGPNSAVWARNTSSTVGSSGVFGWANAAGGNIFGGKFISDSAYSSAAGVKGVSGYGDPLGDGDALGNVHCADCWTSGVRGVDNNDNKFSHGVLGISKGNAVYGALLNTANPLATDAAGALGYRDVSNVKYGVISFGGSLATGVKSFADPHPTDPSKVIRYVSLEGPESGTYFRGKSRFQRGLATIEVPEDFRMVTDPDGLSVQVTPIGQMSTVAVLRIGLDRIVVQGSRDVEFFYLVNGVRKTFKDFQPIAAGNLFTPSGTDSKMPAYLSEEQKRLLIQNGTYRLDGTVNMETARRLGWDKEWEKRSIAAAQPASD